MRILRLQPHFGNGRIYIPKQMYKRDWENNNRDIINEFIEDEYLKFSEEKRYVHDDMLDTLAMVLDANVQYPDSTAGNYYKLYDKLLW